MFQGTKLEMKPRSFAQKAQQQERRGKKDLYQRGTDTKRPKVLPWEKQLWWVHWENGICPLHCETFSRSFSYKSPGPWNWRVGKKNLKMAKAETKASENNWTDPDSDLNLQVMPAWPPTLVETGSCGPGAWWPAAVYEHVTFLGVVYLK